MRRFGTSWPYLDMASKHRLSVNLSPQEHRELAALAEKTGISKAWLGRRAIAEFLHRYRGRDLQLPLPLTYANNTK